MKKNESLTQSILLSLWVIYFNIIDEGLRKDLKGTQIAYLVLVSLFCLVKQERNASVFLKMLSICFWDFVILVSL